MSARQRPFSVGPHTSTTAESAPPLSKVSGVEHRTSRSWRQVIRTYPTDRSSTITEASGMSGPIVSLGSDVHAVSDTEMSAAAMKAASAFIRPMT